MYRVLIIICLSIVSKDFLKSRNIAITCLIFPISIPITKFRSINIIRVLFDSIYFANGLILISFLESSIFNYFYIFLFYYFQHHILRHISIISNKFIWYLLIIRFVCLLSVYLYSKVKHFSYICKLFVSKYWILSIRYVVIDIEFAVVY